MNKLSGVMARYEISQRELANILEINYKTLNHLIGGRTPMKITILYDIQAILSGIAGRDIQMKEIMEDPYKGED